jgi:hypothetical protein
MKGKLVDNVIAWTKKNEVDAKNEFKDSAKEIVSILKRIDKQIS